MTRVYLRAALGCSVLALTVAASCGGSGGVTSAPTSGTLAGFGLGQPCNDRDLCGPGLLCMSGTCQSCACNDGGAACTVNDDCAGDSFCGPTRTCTAITAAGDAGGPGASCQSDGDCGHGLRCDPAGFVARCDPEGHASVGGACMTNADCLGGLGCQAGKCAPFPPSPGGTPILALPSWPGETCQDDAGPTQAYFRVPRGTGDGDFYRLPFPNDVRRDGGKISLANHPTPGAALLGFDVVDRWLRDVEAHADGFSAYPTVFFRFSGPIDLGATLKSDGAIRWADVTDPKNPVPVGFGWSATTARNAYICDNWIGIRTPPGQALSPGHTYAVILSTGILDANQKPIQPPADLTALLAPAAPSDAALAAQWPKYKPLRDWTAGQGVAVGTILDATVFTVGQANAIGPKLAAAVAAAPAPTATGWIRCGDAPSPCPQAAGDRACGSPDPSFDELHALVTLPIFQQGAEPYSTPTDGGDFVLAADGTPQLQRTEQVCMALTVPKGVAMPAGGWPLVVYAHGTGGSFRSAITEGDAARLASVDDGAGGHVRMAMLGIDQVEHGTRRGASTDSPDTLFYNFTNPAAARGNPLQGAADQLALVRFVQGLDLPAASSPTGAEIKVGPIAFWGHSQGATAGGLAMPFASGVLGAVLSGQGAGLVDALVTKKNPVDVAGLLPVVIEDDPSQVGAYHPIPAILQNALDADDPLNYAASLLSMPAGPAARKHVFQPYGQGDTYAPPTTEQNFALAAQLAEATAPSGVNPDAFEPGTPLAVPAGGNVMVGGKATTAIVRQYTPSGYDGHFVAFQNPTAEADVNHFLADALSGKTPLVGR
ncbi:MAG TPA: alpha/beta hydrolase [Polyangiaceae bacterium]|nr:alpha/beta hydrolase [Polyangiaceae bacterium]